MMIAQLINRVACAAHPRLGHGILARPGRRRSAAVMERRAGQAGDRRVRRCGDHGRRRRLRAARGPDRHLRPGRHALGRAPALHPGRLRARPGTARWRPSTRNGRTRSRSRRCSTDDTRGDGRSSARRRLGEHHRRHPRRHDHRRVQAIVDGVAGRRPGIPRFKRPYTELVYQPMLEVLAYLRANGFRTYIVTGGGQEFVRPWTASGSTASRRAGGGLEHRHQVRLRRTASRC